mmetsp:Transcript_11761/g.16287  ORF Transcript_11761/g.16287 Transcript_11761/m.16287 type:complete len:92 (+) Transcript_11761:115-390(+)
MWIHFPSFLVGSMAAGSGCLLIHRELSHRSRLSARWALSEKIEAQIRQFMRENKPAIKQDQKASISTDSTTAAWNKGVATIRDFFGADKGY